MYKRILIFLLFVFQTIAFAQTGKIVGTVSDTQTGEPLVGANVLIEGTYLGGATDINGEFLILNVPPASYIIKVLYVGYRDLLVENIKVSVNLTTNLDLELQTDNITTDAIVIVAEKPLVNKNITNSTNIVSSEDIENLPIRNVSAIVAKQAGVVQQGNNLFVRGSRSDGVAYYVDGVLVNNPVFGGSQTALISNAVEEIQFQAGGYTAEFGGANGGIISTHSKSGTDKYNLNAEVITDNFIGVGDEYLGGFSYGYSEYVLTAGGPLIPDFKNLKFFVAANNLFQKSPPAFYEGFDFIGVKDPTLGANADSFDVFYPDGYQVAGQQNTYNVQGNLTYNLNPVTLRLNGSYRFSNGRQGIGRQAYNTRSRAGINEQATVTASFKLTHALSPTAFYDVIVDYFDDFRVTMDPIFRHNVTAYGDSIENANAGFPNMLSDSQNPQSFQGFGWSFIPEPVVYNLYRKTKNQSFGAKLNMVFQATKHHEFKAGGELKSYLIRRYSMAPRSIAALARSVADGNVKDMYNRLDNYGYDVFGNKLDSGIDGPKQPIFAGAYFQDKMEFSDLIINAGVRFDYIDIDGQKFTDPSNIIFDADGEVDPASLETVDPYMYISPRLGFSFPVTEKTVFHAMYGKFVQQSRLRDVYQGNSLVADNIKGGFAISAPVGFGLRPERTTSFEIGFKQQLGEAFAFDITAFYKDQKDQIQIRQTFAEPGAAHKLYYSFENGDFATIKGMELKLDLRRTQNLAASLDYTYQSALGTGSNPSTGFRQIWQSPTATPYFPQQVAPLDHNQTHIGSANIDYRYAEDDGPTVFGSKVFAKAGANILFSFNSGTSFTEWVGFGNDRQPTESLNSSTTPWVFQVDLRLDKSFQVGPLDANIYMWVTNVFNRKNVSAVFNTTGTADDDGWLGDDLGVAAEEGYAAEGEDELGRNYGDLYNSLYKALTYNSANYLAPRQIRLGLRIDF